MLCIIGALPSLAQTFNNAEASVTFPLNGTLDEPQVLPDGAFTTTSATAGANIPYDASKKDGNITYAAFKPSDKGSATNDENAVEFRVVPSKGVTFTPTKVSANIIRFGTDGGQMSVRVRNAEGEEEVLAQGIKPRRNGKTGDVSNFEYEVPAKYATTKGFSLLINIYDNTGKQFGLNNVVVSGTVNGEKQQVARYTFAAYANPTEAGTISVNPNGTEFDVDTELKLSTQKNFGYKFVNWTDGDGNVLSTETDFTLVLTKNTEVKANYEKLNTYSLDVKVNAPGNSYMVEATPEATIVDGKQMYEEGTKVTLTALSNKIVSFNSWSNGETSAELSLDMTEDKSIEANFSAIDFIAGWDFIERGNNGRKADFAAEDNDADALILRDADGNTIGWLDKSKAASGGYEGKYAAVNWNTEGLGKYYWQTKVNAQAFTNVKVSSAMVYNYNAYTKYDVEYSLDGTNWTKLGTIAMEGAKNWKSEEFQLPADANNKAEVYIRWIADKTSATDGAKSNNDGIGLADVYITGDAKIVDDGKAPQLVSSVPANGADNASANGSIILTFDEKVKLANDNVSATLDGKKLQPVVSGTTVSFDYKGLQYATEYTFSLPANSIADRTDNKIAEAINITFKTKSRPVVAKQLYDFIVPTDGSLKDAFAAASKRTDTSKRFRIFVKKGSYKEAADEKATKHSDNGKDYPDPTIYLKTPNVSIIGEDRDETVITNTVPKEEWDNGYGMANVLEGIGRGDVLSLQSAAQNTYMQDITFKSAMGDARGRDIVMNDGSNKTVCKNVCLWGYQDTYVSNSNRSRFYFEGGLLRGRTDFLCGKGDVYYNKVDLQMCEKGGYVAVPSVPTKYGYIFKDCTIHGEKSDIDGNYTLGRPWGSGTPIALYIDTKMTAQPSAIGWGEMSGGWPARFAEYNSTTATGTTIDLSSRRKNYVDKEKNNHANKPILTKEEADSYTLSTVMGSTDNWDPTALTEQASAPEKVLLSNGKLSWDDSQYTLLWAVCKNGNVVDFTTENHYDNADSTNKWSVRAANEMGGLSEATEADNTDAINEVNTDNNVVSTAYYTLDGTRTNASCKGTVIKVMTLNNGIVKSIKLNK